MSAPESETRLLGVLAAVAALRRIVSLAKDEIARTVDRQGTVTEAQRTLSSIIDIAELALARGAP